MNIEFKILKLYHSSMKKFFLLVFIFLSIILLSCKDDDSSESKKKLLLMGDSISCFFDGSDGKKILEKKLKVDVKVDGLGASKFSEINGDEMASFCERIPEVLNHEFDLLLIFGGINDYLQQETDIGSVNDTSTETFYGALNYLAKKCEGKNVVFITPYEFCYDSYDYTLDLGHGTYMQFRAAMIDVFERNKIKYIDFFNEESLSAVKYPENKLSENDGVHPSPIRCKKMGEIIARELKKISF